MAGFKEGDRVFFPSVGKLVNEGTVEAVEGPFIKVRSDCPGTEYIMAAHASATREGLVRSKAYSSAWSQQQERRRMFDAFARMGQAAVF